MLLLIDNYDSFTYNLSQYFGELGVEVVVRRNDQITIQEIENLNPKYIVISPGPCTPDEAGISVNAIQYFAGKKPILGVCLGHQSIGQAFGGKIVQAEQIMHGKTSKMSHNNAGVFRDLVPIFEATRYHSLVIDKHSIPDCLEITAWVQGDSDELEEIMGIKHKEYAIEGMQFHPESILTTVGHKLLNNFLEAYQ